MALQLGLMASQISNISRQTSNLDALVNPLSSAIVNPITGDIIQWDGGKFISNVVNSFTGPTGATGSSGFTTVNISTSGTIRTTNTTNSTSAITGALRTSGGLGIALNTFLGGTLTTSGVITTNSNTASTTTTTGSLICAGGFGVGERMNVGGNLTANGTYTDTTQPLLTRTATVDVTIPDNTKTVILTWQSTTTSNGISAPASGIFTIPNTGIYVITFTTGPVTVGVPTGFWRFYMNWRSAPISNELIYIIDLAANSNQQQSMDYSLVRRFTAGDTFSIDVHQNSGSLLSLLSETGFGQKHTMTIYQII